EIPRKTGRNLTLGGQSAPHHKPRTVLRLRLLRTGSVNDITSHGPSGEGPHSRQGRVAYSTIEATANPVPPLGCEGRAPETHAGPAMSRAPHGVSLTNVFRNSPAVIAPPHRSPVLRMSATELFSCSRSRPFSGNRHMSSPVRSATLIQLRT